MAVRFVDTDDPDGEWGRSWGGILLIRSVDGLVSRSIDLMDAIDADGNYVDITRLPTGEIVIDE